MKKDESALPEKSKKAIKMPWKLFMIAFVFFINPNINVIDFLPDLIGYLMLVCTLSKISMLCSGLADAKKAFERMILVEIGKIAAFIWIFGLDKSASKSSSVMLLTFVMCVAEGFFAIPAFIKFFEGISELGDYYPNSSIHQGRKGSEKSYTDRIKRFSVAFVVFKCVFTVMPELSELTTAYDDIGVSVGLYQYIGAIRLLCGLPVFIFGILLLIKSIKYFARIAKDKQLNEALISKYTEEILTKKGTTAIKNIKTASWFMTAAAALTVNLTIDNFCITPDILIAIAICFSVFFFSKCAKIHSLKLYIFNAVYAIFCLLSSGITSYFDSEYSHNMISKKLSAFSVYISGVAIGAIKGILFVILLTLLVNEIRKIINEHTGYVQGRNIETDVEKRQIEEYRGELAKEFSHILNFASIYVISDVLKSFYGLIYCFYRTRPVYLNMINIVCIVLLVGATVRALGDLRYSAQTKYMLE